MLTDASFTVSYKCSSCGTFEFFNVSLFKLSKKKLFNMTCSCRQSSLSICKASSADYRINVPCIACGKNHIYTLNRSDMLSKDINIFYCPETGMQVCFAGRDERVRAGIDIYEKEMDELINMFGYDSYFKNTQVILDALNKIHDIAARGNLSCECENRDIELTLLPDKINLSCKKCFRKMTLYAASNKDLKDILLKREILISGNSSCYGNQSPKTLLRKTDN